MSVLTQLTKSNLSLDGTTGLTNRKFGYVPANSPVEPGTANSGYPITPLHRDYSAYENPNKINAVNFNKNGESVLQTATPSRLDETDINCPTNFQAGAVGSVVSQIYKSTLGQNYKDKGPTGGKY